MKRCKYCKASIKQMLGVKQWAKDLHGFFCSTSPHQWHEPESENHDERTTGL